MLPGVPGTRVLTGILLTLLLLISQSAHAASPLTAEIKPVALRPRAFAPEALDVKLTWSGSGLLEGALELSFPDGDENAPLFRSHDLAMTGGVKAFRLLIPSSSSSGQGFLREVQARFVAKSAVLDLGRFDLGVQRGAERSFTLCVARPKLARTPGEFALWQSLRLERFQPDAGSYGFTGASTFPVYVDPEEMPATALAYTPYDLVLLEGADFAQLREKQLAALSRWVLAGGSLCVIAISPLEAGHRRFLIDLLAADPRAPFLDFDADGPALIREKDGVLRVRAGLGRLVVTARGPQSEAEANELPWKTAMTFLWKLRPAQAAAILKGRPLAQVGEGFERWRHEAFPQELSRVLAPKQVRILPTSTMLLLLAGFILVIGPLDWFVLGRLRARRWTWLLFPVTAIACTGLTVLIAGHYLGASNYRSTLTITDLGHDGRVLRETRVEMIFPARNQEVTTEVRHALCSPMRLSGDGMGSRAGMEPVRYEGLFPTSYTVRQSLSQWTPQMNRLTSLEPGADDSGLDWVKLNPAAPNATTAADIPESSAAWDVFEIHRGKFLPLRSRILSPEFVRSICQPVPSGWFSICARFSPNGAADFEDLALASSDDPEFSATITARREGENIHIYRHLYAP